MMTRNPKCWLRPLVRPRGWSGWSGLVWWTDPRVLLLGQEGLSWGGHPLNPTEWSAVGESSAFEIKRRQVLLCYSHSKYSQISINAAYASLWNRKGVPRKTEPPHFMPPTILLSPFLSAVQMLTPTNTFSAPRFSCSHANHPAVEFRISGQSPWAICVKRSVLGKNSSEAELCPSHSDPRRESEWQWLPVTVTST